MTMSTQKEMSQQYSIRREEVERLLTKLTEHVCSPKARHYESRDWGDIGTMAKVAEELTDVCRFLGLEKE